MGAQQSKQPPQYTSEPFVSVRSDANAAPYFYGMPQMNFSQPPTHNMYTSDGGLLIGSSHPQGFMLPQNDLR